MERLFTVVESQTVQLLFLLYSSSTSFTSCTSSIFTSSPTSCSFSSTSSLSSSLRSWQPFFFSPPSLFHLISEGVPPVLSHGADAERLVNFTAQEAV